MNVLINKLTSSSLNETFHKYFGKFKIFEIRNVYIKS